MMPAQLLFQNVPYPRVLLLLVCLSCYPGHWHPPLLHVSLTRSDDFILLSVTGRVTRFFEE